MPDVNAWTVIVPSVVTPTVVAGYALYQQRQTQKEARRAEVRTNIDDASRALTVAHQALQEVQNAWIRGESYSPSDSVARERADRAYAATSDVGAAYDRIVIRLGSGPQVPTKYAKARDATAAWYQRLRAWESNAGAAPTDSLDKYRQECLDTRKAFLEAANVLIGTKID